MLAGKDEKNNHLTRVIDFPSRQINDFLQTGNRKKLSLWLDLSYYRDCRQFGLNLDDETEAAQDLASQQIAEINQGIVCSLCDSSSTGNG